MTNPVRYKIFTLFAFALVTLTLITGKVYARDGSVDKAAVVYAYHRIGQDDFVDSNLSLETFKTHLNLMLTNEYSVKPLPWIIKNLQTGGEDFSLNTIALTFDGAYKISAEKVFPLLIENNIPFTVFIASGRIDRHNPNYMSWDDLRRLKRTGLVTFGALPADYVHLVQETPKAIRYAINTSLSRIEKELGVRPQFFAYPFGEYGRELQKIMATYNFKGAFGLQSGPVYAKSNPLAYPRFSLTESYGDTERFRLTAQTLPLPVTDITPEDFKIDAGVSPQIGFTVKNIPAHQLDRLACFGNGIGQLDLMRLDARRFEYRFATPPYTGRFRINCTVPYEHDIPGKDQRWRWHGIMLTIGDTRQIDRNGEEEF